MVFLMAGPGCNGTSGLSDGEPDFGDPYTIATAPSPELPDEPPAVNRDSLMVAVQYPGGCRDHDFHLNHRTRRDTMELWITHDANGDDCEAHIFERLTLPAPDGWGGAAALMLLDPASDFALNVAR